MVSNPSFRRSTGKTAIPAEHKKLSSGQQQAIASQRAQAMIHRQLANKQQAGPPRQQQHKPSPQQHPVARPINNSAPASRSTANHNYTNQNYSRPGQAAPPAVRKEPANQNQRLHQRPSNNHDARNQITSVTAASSKNDLYRNNGGANPRSCQASSSSSSSAAINGRPNPTSNPTPSKHVVSGHGSRPDDAKHHAHQKPSNNLASQANNGLYRIPARPVNQTRHQVTNAPAPGGQRAPSQGQPPPKVTQPIMVQQYQSRPVAGPAVVNQSKQRVTTGVAPVSTPPPSRPVSIEVSSLFREINQVTRAKYHCANEAVISSIPTLSKHQRKPEVTTVYIIYKPPYTIYIYIYT